MDYQDIIVTCKSCEIKVPMSRTRFDRSGVNLICLKCYKDIYGLNNEKVLQTADPNRSNYSCSYCGYKFSRNKEVDIFCCPYCSKQAVNVDAKVSTIKSPEKRLTDY